MTTVALPIRLIGSAALAIICLVVASCSGSEAESAVGDLFDEDTTVLVANTPGTVTLSGPQRMMMALQGPEGFQGAEGVVVSFEFAEVQGENSGETNGSWVAAEDSPFGLFVAPFAFDVAGLWEVIASYEGERLGSGLVEVVADGPVPDVGEAALETDTPTATTDTEAQEISSDTDPDLDFYDLSIAEAVTNGQATLIAVITPGFCTSELCGPALDAVKAAVADRDGLDVVHVEPFDLAEARSEGSLTPTQAMIDWGLPTEPWVFIVDGDGTITARFEGVFNQAELETALDQL